MFMLDQQKASKDLGSQRRPYILYIFPNTMSLEPNLWTGIGVH